MRRYCRVSDFAPKCGPPHPHSGGSPPGCHRLIHADKLEALSAKARAATAAGDLPGARLAWEEALPLLPPDSVQFATIRQTIATLAAQISAPPPPKPDARGDSEKGPAA